MNNKNKIKDFDKKKKTYNKSIGINAKKCILVDVEILDQIAHRLLNIYEQFLFQVTIKLFDKNFIMIVTIIRTN